MFFKKDLFLNLNLIGDLVKYEVFVIQIFKKTKLKKNKQTNTHAQKRKGHAIILHTMTVD